MGAIKDKASSIPLIQLYQRESEMSAGPILAMAVVSGLANALLLGIINAASAASAQGEMRIKYLLLFAVTMTIFVIGKKYAMTRATVMSEEIVNAVRLRISDKIRRSELHFIEAVGKAEIYTKVTHNTNLISQSGLAVIGAAQSSIMLFFCIMYIAILSKVAFIFTVTSILIGVAIYFRTRRKTMAVLHETTQKEGEFFETLGEVLEGFKELKLNRKKSDDHFSFLERISAETKSLKIRTGINFVTDFMFSDIFFYILIGSIVFLLPRLGPGYGDVLIRIAAAVLFIMGSLGMVVATVPVYARSNVAVENLYALENRLDEARQTTATADKPAPVQDRFDELRFERVMFHYTDPEGQPLFSVGPAELVIKPGEILFIIGGNGSGKSTFLKLLTGLYYPVSGSILRDGMLVNEHNYATYRELFSIIFGDFYLFRRLYGLQDVDPDQIAALLTLMQLEQKTEVVDRVITNLNLSNGQRKRLAMIVALLEERPIYVFDEWAADQDPEFRKYFYEELLQDLKTQGKAVVCVTHDDRYFNCADRILKMEMGRFVDLPKDPV